MSEQVLADILTPNIIGTEPATLISAAMRLMRNNNISCVMVQKAGQPIGIVTERSIVRFMTSQAAEFNDCSVSEIMSSPVITVDKNINIFEAYNQLSFCRMRHLLVTGNGGQPIGIVTLSNIVEHLTYESFVEMKRVSQIMSKIVYTVDRHTNLKDALAEMAEKSMSCIIITDGLNPTGIITERDATRLFINQDDLSGLQVHEVMTPNPLTIQPETPLYTAVEIMKKQKVRRLVVVDQTGKIKGIATQSDLVKGLEGKYIQTLNEVIREKDVIIKNTSKNLAEKKTYLDNILHSSIDYGIIASDLNQRIIYFNPGAEQIFGVQVEDVLGHNVLDLHHHLATKKLKEALQSINDGNRFSFIIEREREQSIQYINATASGIIDQGQKLIGYFLMVSDITQQKLAEQKLRNAHDELEKRVLERTKKISETMYTTIEAIAITLEMRDPYTSGHQRRVSDLAAAIAKEMGLTPDMIEGIKMAGLIHDIGKIRIPSGILCYPGKLTKAEIGIIKPHPEIGYNILKGIEFHWPLADIVVQHHERLDGSGYPHGLKGNEILIQARILCVADVVEAMASHRPYRPARGIDHALEEIAHFKAKYYDPDVVDACLTLFNQKGYAFSCSLFLGSANSNLEKQAYKQNKSHTLSK